MNFSQAAEFLSMYTDEQCYTERCREAHALAVELLKQFSGTEVESAIVGMVKGQKV